MTKKDVVKRIAMKGNIPVSYVEKVLELLPEAILEMEEGERLTIPNLGRFDLVKDGRAKAGLKLEFKPSSVLKMRLEERGR